MQDIERKWQDKWAAAKIAYSEPDNRKKFYMIFAYPYPTGFLHTGHIRGFSYSDMITRFYRLKGYNVFFPTGIHATGNGVIAKANLIQKRDKQYINYLKQNNVTDKDLAKMKEPEGFVDYFAKCYLNDYKSLGLLIDDRAFITTVNPMYNKFITWQFLKLEEKGLLLQGQYYAAYCENCGPVAVDPSESDIASGGHAEKNEYVLLKFKGRMQGFGTIYLVAATLRPETIYGQTNLWVNPDEKYNAIKVNKEILVGSSRFAQKLKYQIPSEIIGTINGADLIGEMFSAPGIDKQIPALPAKFVDVNIGTGIVTSVPSDAPHDYAALLEIKTNCDKWRVCSVVKDIEPIPIIKIKGMSNMPAVDVCTKMNIHTADDERLDHAKKQVYKAGYYKGVMLTGPYKDSKVEDAKEKIKSRLLSDNKAVLFYDLSEEVVCRCGGRVYIHKVDHQWFIDYGQPDLTETSKQHSKTMKIRPDDYYTFFPEALEWFKKRPCARMGKWLGASLPQDDRYVIEAISDSTMYPLFFIVSKFQKKFTHEQLTPVFFDYVFLGKGSAEKVNADNRMPVELITQIKNEVDYWYPLDLNLGGKEHKTVHFPPFVKTHVLLLNKHKWPAGIFVHGWVTSRHGDKVSKSKGGAEPVPQMIKKYGADVMRLYYANVASPFSDMVFDTALVDNYKNKIKQLTKLVTKLITLVTRPEHTKQNENSYMDDWLANKMSMHLTNYISAMQDYDIKKASDIAFFILPNDVEWYLRRHGCSKKLLLKVSKLMLQLWSPVTPHIAEELWMSVPGCKGMVTASLLPAPDKVPELFEKYDPEVYLKSVVDDISNIIRVARLKPTNIFVYTCSSWKTEIVKDSLKLDIKNVMPVLMHKEYNVPKDVQAKFLKSVYKRMTEYKSLPAAVFSLNETKLLLNATVFLKDRFEVHVHILNEDNAQDRHKHKAFVSAPFRPGIVIEC